MNDVYLFAEHVFGYAAVMFVAIALMIGDLLNNYQDILPNLAAILAVVAIAWAMRLVVERQRTRSFLKWWIWYPIQRQYHRLISPVRFLTRGIMSQVEKRVVADLLHDALFEAYHRGTLSRKKYKKYNALLAKAMNLADLAPKKLGKKGKEVIFHHVVNNCRVMRQEMEDIHPKIPEPTGPVVPEDLTTLKFLKQRRSRAA